MTLAELRQKAAEAALAAREFNQSLVGKTWNAEDTGKFNELVAAAKDFQVQAQNTEARETELASMAAITEHYTKPVTGVINPPTGTTVTAAKALPEAFKRYVSPDPKFFFKGQKAVIQYAREVGIADGKDLAEQCQDIHREAFDRYIRKGPEAFYLWANQNKQVTPAELHTLVSNDDTLGGFTVPDDVRSEVLKALPGIAAIRPLCRVITTNRDSVVFPKLRRLASDSRRISGFAGKYQPQNYTGGAGVAPTTQNFPKWDQERITIFDWQPDAVELSPQLLDDTAVNLDQILAECIAQTLAMDEDDSFLTGTGVGEPEGILTAGITTVNSGSASDITYAGLIDLYTNVPSQYRAGGASRLMMKSTTWGNMLKLNTGSGGVYVFPPNTSPLQFLTVPIVFHEGMAVCTTAANKPIIHGNFYHYIIAERQGLRIQRLVERFAPNVGFLPVSRIGGQVVQTDAFRVMTVAA